LVTEPEELAIGLAVALTPPTPSARTGFPERTLAQLRKAAAVVLNNFLPFLKPFGITG